MKIKFNQVGQVSRLLLVLAIIVLVAVAIVYLIMKMAEQPAAPAPEPDGTAPQPVYEATLGSIRFVFQGARDMGSVLKASEASTQYSSWQKDITTTERFIIVTVGAQNKGKQNVSDRAWDIAEIIDSEGRSFVPENQYNIEPWLPEENFCGVLLKPEFDPVPCAKMYEVSKISTGLKIRVVTGKNNDPNNLSSGDTEEAFIDLIVQ